MTPDPEVLTACYARAARQTRRQNLEYLIHVEEVAPEVKRYAAEAWLDEQHGEAPDGR
jgi:hypothetical protein